MDDTASLKDDAMLASKWGAPYRGVSADGLSSIADDYAGMPDVPPTYVPPAYVPPAYVPPPGPMASHAALSGALSGYGDSLSSYALPSDPAMLQGLISQLQSRFPSIQIPHELREDIPPPSMLQPHPHPPLPNQHMTEESLRVLSTLHPPVMSAVRLESSVDLNSPVRFRPSTSPVRDPVATARVLHDSNAAKALLFNPVIPEVPIPPTPQLPPAYVPEVQQKVEEVPPSRREMFYDQLGRQLTSLLLEAGTPLPRFPVAPDQADTTAQTHLTGEGGVGGHGEDNTGNASSLTKARSAAEMFLKDYYEHKRALGDAERKLNTSENENLALRSQLDLSMVKMIGAQKEVDKYSSYFNMSRGGPNAPGEEGSQVKALLKKMQEMSLSIQKAEEEKLRLIREEEKRIQDAVKRAVAAREEEMFKMKSQLKEKKKVIKDMKLMLHSYLANKDPSSTEPNMAFLDLISHTDNHGAATLSMATAL